MTRGIKLAVQSFAAAGCHPANSGYIALPFFDVQLQCPSRHLDDHGKHGMASAKEKHAVTREGK